MSEEREERHDSESSEGSNKVVGGIVAAILLIWLVPAGLLGLLMNFVLLRKLHIRPIVSFLISLAIITTGTITILATEAWARFLSIFSNLSQIGELWSEAIPLLVGVNLIVGAVFGFAIICWEVSQLKANPHRTKQQGLWSYNLKFRKTPWELLKKKKEIARLRSGILMTPERSPLGYNEKDDRVEYRFASEARKHTIITGASGSGKTITMLSLMLADIKAGRNLVAVDFKRSDEFSAKLAEYAKQYGRKFYHFEQGGADEYKIKYSPGQASYDPFASGSGESMLMGMRDFGSNADVYRQHMEEALALVFRMLQQADRNNKYIKDNIDWNHGVLYTLRSALTPANLQNLLNACVGTDIEEDAYDFIQEVNSKKDTFAKRAIEEIRVSLRIIFNSPYGQWMKKSKHHERHIDLLELLTGEEPVVVLFSFKADSDKNLAKWLGSMIFSDLMAVSSKARAGNGIKNGVGVYSDEFQAVPPDTVSGLLEKSRSSNMGITLACQNMEQVITSAKSDGEAHLKGILVTCSTFITHAGMTENSAQRMVELLPKERVVSYRQTNQSSNKFLKSNKKNRENQMISANEEQRHTIEAKEFMELAAPTEVNGYKSEAIFITKSPDDPRIKKPGNVGRKVWMIPPQVILDPYEPPIIGESAGIAPTPAPPAADREQQPRTEQPPATPITNPQIDESHDYPDDDFAQISENDEEEWGWEENLPEEPEEFAKFSEIEEHSSSDTSRSPTATQVGGRNVTDAFTEVSETQKPRTLAEVKRLKQLQQQKQKKVLEVSPEVVLDDEEDFALPDI